MQVRKEKKHKTKYKNINYKKEINKMLKVLFLNIFLVICKNSKTAKTVKIIKK